MLISILVRTAILLFCATLQHPLNLGHSAPIRDEPNSLVSFDKRREPVVTHPSTAPASASSIKGGGEECEGLR